MGENGQERLFRVDLASELGERRRTPQGGLIAPANLTRTGIFTYRMPDGSSRRELRHPDDVFHPDSLASYPLAPVTVDHPGRVHPGNWKTHAVGTVGSTVARNGNFASGDIHLQHGDAMNRAERGELKEVSCGYTCDIDPTPGQYQGQPFDVAQKNIRINHVAIGPSGWGRMGSETAMKLDSAEAWPLEATDYLRDDSGNRTQDAGAPMPTAEEKAAQDKIEADKLNEALEKARLEAAQAREDAKTAKTEGERLAASAREDKAKIATLTAENELLQLQAQKSRNDGKTAEEKRQAEAEQQLRVEEIVTLRADARMVFASVQDPEGKDWKADGKNADAIRREVVLHLEPTMKLDSLDGNGLARVYDMAMSHERKAVKARLEAKLAAEGVRRADAGAGGGDDDEDGEPEPNAEMERKKMLKRKKDAWKMPKKDRAAAAMASK